MSGDKHYLGDAVYYQNDGHGVMLTTENGISVTSQIYLEPEVLAALLKMLGRDYDQTKLRAIIGEKEVEGG